MIDINDFRAWHTVILLGCFIGIIIWAYSGHRRKAFDEAANLPFADEKLHAESIAQMNDEQASKEEKKS
jgi:cytochrome c oxidase cbb3-type subunit IV